MPISPSILHVSLAIRGGDRRVPARLEFRNTSNHKAFPYKVAGCVKGTIENDVFVIEGKDGMVRYQGIYARRRTPEMPVDFIEIAPGSSFSTQVDLGDTYAFPAGPGVYRARYEAYDPSHTEGPDLAEMKSEEVTFKLPG